MRTPLKLSAPFYILNLTLLTFGIYLYYVHRAFRFIMVYSILNIVLYILFSWTNTVKDVNDKTTRGPLISSRVVIAIIILLLTTLGIMTSQSIYTRPSISSILTGLALTLMIANLLEVAKPNLSSREKSTTSLMFTIFILLYIYLSIYLVQPSSSENVPLYATVDAYRDYTNAQRLLKLARIVPEYMVLEKYYRPFPVVPLWLTIINLVSGLPIPTIHITMALLNLTLILVLIVLLSRAITKVAQGGVSTSIHLLPALLLLLFPTMIDPMFTLTPLMFSLPLISLCVYTAFKVISTGIVSLGNILIMTIPSLIVVPLHAATSIIMIMFYVLCVIAVVITNRMKRLLSFLTTYSIMLSAIFIVYLIFPHTTPVTSLYNVAKTVYQVLNEVILGFPVLVEKVGETQVYSFSEVEPFLQALSVAYLPSFLTTSLVIALGEHSINSARHLRIIAFCCGALTVVLLGVGYITQLWRIDLRYFLFPTIPIAVLPLTMLFTKLSRGCKLSKKLAILIILSACMFSITFSPGFLHEVNPSYARLIPTEEEKFAGIFIASFLDYSGQSIKQIVADWPYYAYIRSLIWSQSIGIESYIKVPILMYEEVATMEGTLFILRDYFYKSKTLQNVPYVKPLLELEQRCNNLTKIFDSSSTFIYLCEQEI